MTATAIAQRLYHGTRADLKAGDLIAPGHSSNYGQRRQASWVYPTGTLEAAVWGAELAAGDGPGRIYVVEPIGAIKDDPNLTDKKFPLNPNRPYRGSSIVDASEDERSRAPILNGTITHTTDCPGHAIA